MVAKEEALCNGTIKLEPERLPKIKLNPPSLVALEELLHDIYVVGRPEPNDYDLRRNLVRVFNVMAKEVYGNSNPTTVEAFGSFLMDMFSVHSDLDLSINFSNEPVELPRDKKIKALRKFSKKLYLLQSKGHVSGVAPIMSAKVPVLKVVDRGSGIECDISVANKDGILKSQIVSIVSVIDDRFQKLSSLMKAWARARGINSSKDGTLNSLSIILLVAFHLQTREPPILPPFSALLKDGTDTASVGKEAQAYLHYGKENKESLAELFATLLAKLVSFEFLWPKGLCVSTYEGSWISKTGKYKGGISVEDFTDRSQNVARAVKAGGMKVIYNCIHSSFHHLSAFMDGKIQGAKLKTLLFGAEPIPFSDKKLKNVKRSFPSHDTASTTPLNPVMTKKARRSEAWSSQKLPSVISGFVLGSQQELRSGLPNQSVQDGVWGSQNSEGVQTAGGSSWEGDQKYSGIQNNSALKASHSSPFVNPGFVPAFKQENFTGFGQQEELRQNGGQGAGNWGKEQIGGWGSNGTHGVENLGGVQTGGRSSWGGDQAYGEIQNHLALKAPNGSPFVNPGFVPVIKQEIYSRLGQQEELLQNGGQGAGNSVKQQTGGWGWGREGTHGAENFQKAPFVNPQSFHGFQQGPPGQWSSQDWGRDQTGGSGWQRDQIHGVENFHRPPFIPPAFGHGFQQRPPCLEEQNRAGWNERWGSQELRRDLPHGAENFLRPPFIPEFRPWFQHRPL